MSNQTQKNQIIEALRDQGGYATLKRIYETVDFSSWGTQTPQESVRCYLQRNKKDFFRIQPGLWALNEHKEEILRKLNIISNCRSSEERFSHSYYQGLLLEIGKFEKLTTYIPAQDQHHLFLDKELGTLSDLIRIPSFTHENLLRKARTVDVVWFNEREMPSNFFEVEHTTDFKNSLFKFYELQDFYSEFVIVASKHRKPEFLDKLGASIFKPIEKRVKFWDYEKVAKLHSNLSQRNELIL